MPSPGTARSFVPFRFPDAGTGGKSTVALGQGAEPDMYLTTNGTTYLSKRRDGVPGKRNDRQLPQVSGVPILVLKCCFVTRPLC